MKLFSKRLHRLIETLAVRKTCTGFLWIMQLNFLTRGFLFFPDKQTVKLKSSTLRDSNRVKSS